MKLYLAAPLDVPAHRASNERLAHDLEAAGHTVYLPQRDGGLYAELCREGMLPDRAAAQIFSADADALAQCDALVARWPHDGNLRPDAGQVFELGYACALGKPCLVFDLYAIFQSTHTNPMLAASVRRVVYSGHELLTYLEDMKP